MRSERYAICCAAPCDLIEQRRDELARTITAETGFPIADAQNEVTRAIQTFLIAAEEGKRLVGEVVPIEAAPGNAHRMAFTIRVPRGVVCGITSFNAPLNFVAHKAAPALAVRQHRRAEGAAGDAVQRGDPLRDPARRRACRRDTSTSCRARAAKSAAGSSRTSRSASTPSPAAPASASSCSATSACGRSRSSSAASPRRIVCDDGDLDRAAPRVVNSAFRRAGQACTSTQRLFVQRPRRSTRSSRSSSHATAGRQGRRSARSRDDDRADDQRGRSGARRAVGATKRSPRAPGSSPAVSAAARC